MMIKSAIRRNLRLYYILAYLKNCFLQSIKFNFQRILRQLVIDKSSKYKKLKQYKNIHDGKRCFIVATGPSLKLEDLDKIKNQISFSMNSIILSYGETSWRPTYYGIQDSRAYNKLEKEIIAANIENLFCGISSKKLTPNIKCDHIPYPLDLLDHGAPYIKNSTKFSDDIYDVVYDGYSITYSLLQIAVYMGFKEIYLLGVDCDYRPNSKNYIKDYIKQTNYSAGFLMGEAYNVAKEYADKNGIKIYNASRGGKLEIFERVDFDKITFLEGNENEDESKLSS